MKTKLLIILISLFVICSLSLLVGCGNGSKGNTPDGDDGDDIPSPTYTVTWCDENGETITATTVGKGVVPSYNYVKSDTAEWDYTVEGWSLDRGGARLSSIPAAEADATYYAVVSREKQTYVVNFVTNCGSSIPSERVEYGTTTSKPETPKNDGYRLVGWYTDVALTEEVDWAAEITGNATYYAAWVEKIDVLAFLTELLCGYELNPYSYIPEPMRPGYAENLVNRSDIITDYSSSVSVSDIASGGFGEQWNMILDNLQQSMTFFNLLSVVDGLTSTSVSVFNDYIDKNPADTAHHSFTHGIYSVTIDFDGEVIFYVLDYTAELPVLGLQSVQIAMHMDVASKDKSVRIQLGDANALTYSVGEDFYEFAIKYLGVRRAYFSIKQTDDGAVSGHIYEYLTFAGAELAGSADFYITDEYVTAIGNKADGMPGFDGYICEVYKTESGRLLGYEVRETLSLLTFDTLWFDLSAFTGFNSISYKEATDDTAATFFINGREWKAKKTLGSRRFDIEFRTRYFYEYDEAGGDYVKIAVSVPMLFVQEKHYDSLADDVFDTNGLTLISAITENDLEKITTNYATLVDIFIENKDVVTPQLIIEYIGKRIEF